MQRLVVSLMVCVLTGCTGISKLRDVEQPLVRVVGVRLAEQTDEGALFRVIVELENPNPVALPVVTSQYTLTVDGMNFAYTSHPRRTLPARGIQTLDLPAALATGGRDMSGMSYLVSGLVAYEPPGQLRRLLTESGVPLPTVNYGASGTLP